MMTKTSLITLATVSLFAFGATAGDITGKITLKGTPPPEKAITPLKNDPSFVRNLVNFYGR